MRTVSYKTMSAMTGVLEHRGHGRFVRPLPALAGAWHASKSGSPEANGCRSIAQEIVNPTGEAGR